MACGGREVAAPSASPGSSDRDIKQIGDGGFARRQRLRSRGIRLAWQLAVFVVFVGLWQLSVEMHLLTLFAVSSPIDVERELLSLSASGVLWSSVGITLEETVIGFVTGVIVGVLLGVVLVFWQRTMKVLDPYVTVLNSLPRFALAPLFILWFGIGLMSKIVLAFSLVVFIMFTNTLAGGRAIDQDIVTSSRVLGATRRQIVLKVMLPSIVPWVVAAMRLAIAYAIAGAVVGEMFASEEGIGNLLSVGSSVFNTAEIFAALGVIAVIAGILDTIGRAIERYVLRWKADISLN